LRLNLQQYWCPHHGGFKMPKFENKVMDL
jgi:hypothetical protein